MALADMPKDWRHVMTLQVLSSPHGLVIIQADEPRNIGLVGVSLNEVLTELVPVIETLQEAGGKFPCLDGVKLRTEVSDAIFDVGSPNFPDD